MKGLTRSDYQDLAYAKSLLEHPGLTSRLAEIAGKPIEQTLRFLPADWKERVSTATKGALSKGMEFVVGTLGAQDKGPSQNGLHKLLVAASGAGSGALGILALPVELPVSTCLMLRSIADIARSEGHDIRKAETKTSCMQVLALGNPKNEMQEAVESGYWSIRTAMARAVSEASAYIAEKGTIEEGAPALLRFMTRIASRFGTVVSEEVAAKAVPLLGAFSGAAINYLFMDHFQKMATGHFIVQRLEKKYGQATVQESYRLATV